MINHPIAVLSLAHVTDYITEVFRPCTLLAEWTEAKALPLYLQANWAYRRLSLDGRSCLLMWDGEGQQQETAQKLKKAIATVAERFSGPVIYGVSDTSSYNRKRLIDQDIAFVVPGKQLYLPFAALDLRENFAPARLTLKTSLGACAQQLVLLKCLDHWQSDLPGKGWAERLGLSKMTVSRAYKELAEFGLAQMISQGRQVQLDFEANGQQLWKMALPYLSSPIKQEISISINDYQGQQNVFQFAAGEWALTKQGMLISPKQSCFAVAGASWTSLKKLIGIVELARPDEESVQIQLWRYDPGTIYSHAMCNNSVDPLSLYLSLREVNDERVQMALEELLLQVWNEHTERLK
ncbi:hypothetical protein RGU70_13355 [Herbaspirillum sp. RTI4]|uniref:hypothetical protein n=1 Tax=Herbaspirillum sp. RTI4 TaxID=3048640 RepID=UPI002AB3C0BF|nr:hypothetical protein [Herbaspirillum sp. RTI4]MDY7579303.1 hypothetical protein [Herbaspirillum sp. RTI4]MEA9980216.1 hypothetical protein [Herbaspirillum sp. RTI4]